jgi:hypothetical protein
MKDGKTESKTLFPLLFPCSTSSFLFEIGVEELPADDVDTAYATLSTRVPTLLKELNLAMATSASSLPQAARCFC